MLAVDSASSPVPHRYPLRSRRYIDDFAVPDAPAPIPAHQTPSRPGRRRAAISASPARKCNRPAKIAKRTPMASVVEAVLAKLGHSQATVRSKIRDFLLSLTSAETLLLDDVAGDEQWFLENVHANRRISFGLLDSVQPPSYARLGSQERFEHFLSILASVRTAYLRLEEKDRAQLNAAADMLSFNCRHHRHAVTILRDMAVVEKTMVRVLWSLIRFYVKSIFNADEFSDTDLDGLRACAALNLQGIDVGALVLISLRKRHFNQDCSSESPTVFDQLRERCLNNRLIFGAVSSSELADRWRQLRALVEHAQDFEELQWTAPLLDFEKFIFESDHNTQHGQ